MVGFINTQRHKTHMVSGYDHRSVQGIMKFNITEAVDQLEVSERSTTGQLPIRQGPSAHILTLHNSQGGSYECDYCRNVPAQSTSSVVQDGQPLFASAPATTGKDMRPRRQCQEVNKIYRCGWHGCETSCGTSSNLNQYVAIQSHGIKPILFPSSWPISDCIRI